MYVVFSYGNAWPLYIKYLDVWYENGDYDSRTTSRHRSNARPVGEDTTITSLAKMQALYCNATIPTPPSVVELMLG